jgi:plastocyanin
MSAASGYAEMRLQYIVDVDQSEPDLAPIADVSKFPPFVEMTQSFGTAYDALRRGDTTTAQPLLGRLHDLATAMTSSPMAAMMPEMVGEADVAEQELRALALLRRDSKADAVATLRKAAAQEDALPFEFGPPEIRVKAGTTITWKNEGAKPHSATAVDKSFDTAIFQPGESKSAKFDTPGTFKYYCQLHGTPDGNGMIGTVVPWTIFSKPRLKGSKWPVRLIAPSAKIQTMWPLSSSLRARLSDSTISRRLVADTGIERIKRKNQ